ncbi:MAG: cysteine--tRNA ligase [alpha proteobacterium MED-G10]|nr:MAG: cysteine--tRNA ligase [alpha proteobacterium MED-G10]
MTFLIYDSLTKKKQQFVPVDKNNVRVYACGPTVYNYAHVGNARMSVVTDLLIRVLKTIYKNVKFVSNITDVDDKIIEAAKKEKVKIEDITSKFEKIYNQDMLELNVRLPDIQPKATEYIKEMIIMIEKLVQNQSAYISNDNVIFNVKKYKHYGVLSRRTKDEQIAGSRIEVADYKKNPEDFVLWKPSKEDEPGWESPWGRGRPGWHIECSAMSEKCLKTPFDIHCGGVDLTFPHHENEIAQSCSLVANDCEPSEFSKYWFHNGFVTSNGEKMSKSLGNIKLVNDMLKEYSGPVIRLSLLSSHYRQPLDWSKKILDQSKKNILRFSKVLKDIENKVDTNNLNQNDNDFIRALYDDLNTPKALAVLNGWFDDLKKNSSSNENLVFLIKQALQIFGLDIKRNQSTNTNITEEEKIMIEKMIQEREIARKNKDFRKADELREKLKEMRIFLDDTSGGTIWKKNES